MINLIELNKQRIYIEAKQKHIKLLEAIRKALKDED